jgi:hypothetical protein
MLRSLSIGFTALAFCALQSGCCCCRLPVFAPAPPQFVINVPNDPPVVNPPVFNPPQNNPPGFNPQPFKGPREYVYKQTTGQLMLDNQVIGTGYSGKGQGRNNPGMQNQKNVGPIPAGEWKIMGKRVDDRTGELIVDTLPSGHNAAGRFPGTELFKIHGETNPPGMSPAGDIVMPREALDKIDPNGFPTLKVVP